MGQLTKLKIVAYQDKNLSSATGNEFTMMLNPTSYEQKKGISYNMDESMEGGNHPTYHGYKDENLAFEFQVDTTGVISGTEKRELPDIIKELENTIYAYVGTAHEPPYLKVEWGTLNFQGRINNMQVNYIFFSPEGKPLRAKIKLEFVRYVDIATQEKEKNKSSPDLSHIITVTSGDTLPALCQRIYNSTMYCQEVARINGLTGFRYIEPGTELLFPPLTNK